MLFFNYEYFKPHEFKTAHGQNREQSRNQSPTCEPAEGIKKFVLRVGVELLNEVLFFGSYKIQERRQFLAPHLDALGGENRGNKQPISGSRAELMATYVKRRSR